MTTEALLRVARATARPTATGTTERWLTEAVTVPLQRRGGDGGPLPPAIGPAGGLFEPLDE